MSVQENSKNNLIINVDSWKCKFIFFWDRIFLHYSIKKFKKLKMTMYWKNLSNMSRLIRRKKSPSILYHYFTRYFRVPNFLGEGLFMPHPSNSKKFFVIYQTIFNMSKNKFQLFFPTQILLSVMKFSRGILWFFAQFIQFTHTFK